MILCAIVPSAGASRRMGRGLEKPYRLLNGKPLLIHSLLVLERTPWVDEVVLVVARRRLGLAKRLMSRYRLRKVREVTAGGRTRTESVFRGILRADPKADYLLVHDGARPIVSPALLTRVMRAARQSGAAIPALPVGPTIKEVSRGWVVRTLSREALWEVQTPQIFRRSLLWKALNRRREEGTDCASLVERLGYRVKVVPGDPANIKVTTPLDLVVAEALLRQEQTRGNR